MTEVVDRRRVHILKDKKISTGPVVYWLSREQRVHDNWALLYARELADEAQRPLAVVFNLVPAFLNATDRQYRFMLDGLQQLAAVLDKYRIPFFMLTGEPSVTIPRFIKKYKIGALVTDFSPLRVKRQWHTDVADRIKIAFHEVDAHNIVPGRLVSDKREFAAYTIRPKINRLLGEFLKPFPKIKKQNKPWPTEVPPVDWKRLYKRIKVVSVANGYDRFRPGEKDAVKVMRRFFSRRLPDYDRDRNDPNREVQSELSPYFHFGQISAQAVALEAMRHDRAVKSQEAFLEQLIVRRELADNFCLHNSDYDSFDGFPDWARATLTEHAGDKREYLYGRDQLEEAATHDDLWNAAQTEMTVIGKMHGYLRMYWAKKILEWSVTPAEAMTAAVFLNDKYGLDGRDPGGYAGIAWSIGGVHDRPWFEREVFGKIRYMSYNGCKRKFDITAYIDRVNRLRRGEE